VSDYTEDNIRDAEPAQLNKWISDIRCSVLHMHDGRYQWRYKQPEASRVTAHAKPKPYATEWWAAGPLLEELAEQLDPFYGLRQEGLEYHWLDGEGVQDCMGETAQLAIARAWLLAHHRGLLEDDHEHTT